MAHNGEIKMAERGTVLNKSWGIKGRHIERHIDIWEESSTYRVNYV